ncbi:hypothetical protein HAX54_029587 [Datura stramonium]|uniref:DUF4005 domain-containing protein n=1 Tax=Datura stramonium TaxID=4076 RepID=A0ABS8V687_DATST|nr:hypothetical protein [Datura stramonium]
MTSVKWNFIGSSGSGWVGVESNSDEVLLWNFRTICIYRERTLPGDPSGRILRSYARINDDLSTSNWLRFSSMLVHLGQAKMYLRRIRQQATLSGFEPDKSNWGWNWLERWMAVRPWENRFLDVNVRDGVVPNENESADPVNGIKNQVKFAGKKQATGNLANDRAGPSHSSSNSKSNEKAAASLSDGCSSSQMSACTQETPAALVNKPKSKPNLEDLVEEASSRPALGSRSHSNPKERSTPSDKQGKQRLSLPSSDGVLEPLILTFDTGVVQAVTAQSIS